MFIKIRGKTHYLWRAVVQYGIVLDILVTSRRDALTPKPRRACHFPVLQRAQERLSIPGRGRRPLAPVMTSPRSGYAPIGPGFSSAEIYPKIYLVCGVYCLDLPHLLKPS